MRPHPVTLVTACIALVLMAGACASPATAMPTPQPTPTPVPTLSREDLVALGRTLASRHGCAACHTADGNPSVGPTWAGLFGRQETLADGSQAVADEAYLRESVLDPNAKVVKGFGAGIMPQDFGTRLSEQDIQSIVEYIKALAVR